MTIQADDDHDADDDILELKPEDEAPPEEGDQDGEEGEDDEEELIVQIGEEAAPASDEAPEWVRDLRKRNRELERKVAEFERGPATQVPEVGDKPTLEDCEWDDARFEKELNTWLDRKSQAERVKEEAGQAESQAQEAWKAELATYSEQSKTLGAKDFEAAEAEVTTVLSPTQQSLLVQGAENKALLVYALGKNPAKLRELAKITDPVKFAFAAARLEGQTKMEKRRPSSQPERTVRGSAPLNGGTDATLERLEREAEQSGDRSKVIAHRRKLADRARK